MPSFARSSFAAVAFAALSAIAHPAFAWQPGDYLQKALQQFPQCEDGQVVARLTQRFNSAEIRGLYDPAHIGRVWNITERSVESFGPSPVLRRYCRAHTDLGHSRPHTIHYRIEHGMGLAGTGWKVEFCVPGHDRWRAYGGWCRTVRR